MRIGSLFTGYGGLDMATEAAFDATTAWVADIDKGACKILAHRYPDVPNLGDITVTDWSSVEPVDIITGGSPCQDLSHAGRRAGMTKGTRSNLWVAMREAIAQLRPTYVIWENVRGAYSACAESEIDRCLGRCPRCLGPDSGARHAPNLRALGRVLGDLSDLGYDCQWRGLRAADVGAPHGRFRVFVVARLADAAHDDGGRGAGAGTSDRGAGRATTDAPRNGRHEGRAEPARLVGRPDAAERGRKVGRLSLLPSPRTSDTNGAGRHGDGGPDLRTVVTLLPTPTTTQRAADPKIDERPVAGPNLHNAVGLMPTPSVGDVQGGRKARSGERSSELLLNGLAHEQRFGQYAAAIGRWESTIGRSAPAPTEPTGRGGAHRLSPRFTEWMMGLPAGWITDVPSVTRNEALKACGNGVVPQQAFAAITDALDAWAVMAA